MIEEQITRLEVVMMRKNEIEIYQEDPGGDPLGQDLERGGDDTSTGLYLLISCAASLAVAIIAAAVTNWILMGETASAGTYLVTANMIAALVAVVLWSISFVGMTRYLKPHFGNGLYLLISCAASLAVAIIAAAVTNWILMGETASAGTYLVTANMIAALVAVVLWSISFVGMTRYLKSHYGNKQRGQTISL
jgi:hypothetical protein